MTDYDYEEGYEEEEETPEEEEEEEEETPSYQSYESAENPTTGAKVMIGVGVIAALGVGAYYLYSKSKPASASSTVPAINIAGPYTVVQQMQPGGTYLVSMPSLASSGISLQQGIANLQTASSGQFKVLQAWDVGQVPTSWPESNSNEWRLVLQYNGAQPQGVPGATIYATNGATS